MKRLNLCLALSLALVFSDCTSTQTSQTDQRDPDFRPERRGPGPGGPGGASRNNPAADNQEGDSFIINLDASECDIDIEEVLETPSLYKEVIDEANNKRTISINSIASHEVGAFPNPGNPNTISESRMTASIPLRPQVAPKTTNGQGYETGILFSGVSIDPYTAEMFIGSDGQMNPQWNITTLTSTENLGLDCNNAHVQPTGKYHYHGTPSAYLQDLEVDGQGMQKIGYAADGFPIYYKYGYDESGELISHSSGYQLKEGKRPGDGITAPDGSYNGRYFNDYQYVEGISELDACNGKWGKTPESDNEYYYVVTDNFPSVPLCFSGTPSVELNKRGGNGQRPQGPPPGGRGQRPPRRNGGNNQ